MEGTDEEEGRGSGKVGSRRDAVERKEAESSVGGMEGMGTVAGAAGEGVGGGKGVVVRVENESGFLCVEGLDETKEGGQEGRRTVAAEMGMEDVES